VVARVPVALSAALPAPPASRVWRTFTLIAIAVLLAAAALVIAWLLQRTRAERATENRPA
jgi:uncharacterized membrane protein